MATWIPLGLDVQYERRPVAVLTLVGLMAVLLGFTQGRSAEALEPFLLDPHGLEAWQFVSGTLLHANGYHLLFNALYLWVFGRYLEEQVGGGRFLALFLLFGMGGDFAYLATSPALPTLGASGAVAGCMGFALFTAPRATVQMSWFLFGAVPMRRFALPAWFLLGLWIAVQLTLGWSLARDGVVGSVNHAAHVGGFAAGIAASLVLRSAVTAGTGWHVERPAHGGARVSSAYHELTESEAVWRTIEAHLKRKREAQEKEEARAPDRRG